LNRIKNSSLFEARLFHLSENELINTTKYNAHVFTKIEKSVGIFIYPHAIFRNDILSGKLSHAPSAQSNGGYVFEHHDFSLQV